jgi:hypothetical protein
VSDAAFRSIEDVFIANVDALLDRRDLTRYDLMDRLEEAGYTTETPATVLLNDAVAIAAVLGVSPLQLLVPPDHDPVDLTPALAAETRALGLWLRGLRPLLEDHLEEFFRSAPLADLDADLVAENWVWSERVRTTALVFLIDDAVRNQELDRVRLLSELATRQLDQAALAQADERIDRFADEDELQAALERATRYRRQATVRRVAGNDSGLVGP